MVRIIPSAQFFEGRWQNGLGISWEIAKEPADAAGLAWRFAVARLDADVPFSQYDHVDRVFTLIDGPGLDLHVQGLGTIEVHRPFETHRFPGELLTHCHLLGGACRSLNLFMARDAWRADVEVVKMDGDTKLVHEGQMLLFALRGTVQLNGETLDEGDAAIAEHAVDVHAQSNDAIVYVARLFARGA